MRRMFVPVALLVLLFATPAGADVLVLKDGRIIERPVMEKTDGGIRVVFDHGKVVVPDRLVQDVVLTKASAQSAPATPEDQEKIAKGLVRFHDEWMKPEERDRMIQKQIAEHKAAVEDIKAHQLWRNRWKDTTKHFEFEYTVPDYIFSNFRDTMEAYFDAFSREWKVRQPREYGKLTVCFYTDLKKFQQISGASNGVLGYFRYIPPLELNFYYDRLDPALTQEVMFHETNHYLQKLLNVDFDMPHFPGESLAEYYGSSHYDPKTKKVESGLVLEGRLVEIQDDIAGGTMLGLEKMITTPQMYEHYTWGWSLVYFLMHEKKYHKEFEKFIRELAFGKHVKRVPGGVPGSTTVEPAEIWEVFKSALRLRNDEDVKALETEWHEYVKNSLKLVSARGFEEAAKGALSTGRPIRAKRLFKEAIEKGTKSPNAFYRYADLLADDGEWDEAAENCGKAIELDPLEATYHAEMARILYAQEKKDEAKKSLQLAMEMDPDNPYLQFEFATLIDDLK